MAKENTQPGIKGTQFLDPENRLPHGKYEYVLVSFDVADHDTEVVHSLNPVNAEEVLYYVVKTSGPGVVYQDLSATRRPWQRTHIYLRASQPVKASVLVYIPNIDIEGLDNVPVNVPATTSTTTVVSDTRLRSFGITIDAGASVISIGLKGMVRVPISGRIQKWTLMSTDAIVITGSMEMSVWKDGFPNFYPTVADSIVAAAPISMTSATRAENTTLAGWSRSFNAGDVFAFNVDSVALLKRVTVVIDYLPT